VPRALWLAVRDCENTVLAAQPRPGSPKVGTRQGAKPQDLITYHSHSSCVAEPAGAGLATKAGKATAPGAMLNTPQIPI